jgi:hypothetical protein
MRPLPEGWLHSSHLVSINLRYAQSTSRRSEGVARVTARRAWKHNGTFDASGALTGWLDVIEVTV